ncbi:MAG: SEL1-like repeat protein [Chthoniobacteraceae bacterium]
MKHGIHLFLIIFLLGNCAMAAAPDYSELDQAAKNFLDVLDKLSSDVVSAESADDTVKIIMAWADANMAFADANEKFMEKYPEIRLKGAPPADLAPNYAKLLRMNTDYTGLIAGFHDLSQRYKDKPEVIAAMAEYRKSNARLYALEQLRKHPAAAVGAPTPKVAVQTAGVLGNTEIQAFDTIDIIEGNERDELPGLLKDALRGKIAAEEMVGRIYLKGAPGVPVNLEEGVKWTKIAALSGVSTAEYNLAVCLLNGTGITMNREEAMRMFVKSANHGCDLAEDALGRFYSKGVNVPLDHELAYLWYEKAARQGNSHAQLWAGAAYLGGDGVAKDEVAGCEWVRKAAEQGNVPAEYQLGKCLLAGLGTKQDAVESVKWLRKAADQGNAKAQFTYGLCCSHGRGGLPADPAEAVRWFRFAAMQGSPSGENALGYAYDTGEVVKQDFVEAWKWYILATGQDKEPSAKRNAEINMKALDPKMTPAQKEEAKQRASQFVPEPEKENNDPSKGSSSGMG